MCPFCVVSCKRVRYKRTLQWRHNDRGCVSNHQTHDCLLDRLFRHRSKTTSKLRVTGPVTANEVMQYATVLKEQSGRKPFFYDSEPNDIHAYSLMITDIWFPLWNKYGRIYLSFHYIGFHLLLRGQLVQWIPCNYPAFTELSIKHISPWYYDMFLIVRRAGLLWSQQDFEWRWSVPLFKCLTVLEFSFILFDLCLLITFFNFIMNYVPIVTFWIFTYHKIWILSIMFCFIWSYWIIYFLACLEVSWRVVS